MSWKKEKRIAMGAVAAVWRRRTSSVSGLFAVIEHDEETGRVRLVIGGGGPGDAVPKLLRL